MNKNILLGTNFGQLSVEIDSYGITREIDFKEGALTISGLNIKEIYSDEAFPLSTHPALFAKSAPIVKSASIVRSFEKYLLGKERSFTCKDVKGFVSKFKLDKTYSKSFSIVIDPKDAEGRWFEISSLGNDRKSFKFEIASFDILRDEAEDIGSTSWTIRVGDNADRFVTALEYICFAADAINKGKLSNFIVKMPFLLPK